MYPGSYREHPCEYLVFHRSIIEIRHNQSRFAGTLHRSFVPRAFGVHKDHRSGAYSVASPTVSFAVTSTAT